MPKRNPRGELAFLRGELEEMSEYWESLGMSVRIVDEDVASPRVYGIGGPVQRTSFNTNAAGESYRLGATAPCSEGDDIAVKRDAIDRRNQGETLPGDEYGDFDQTDAAQ